MEVHSTRCHLGVVRLEDADVALAERNAVDPGVVLSEHLDDLEPDPRLGGGRVYERVV